MMIKVKVDGKILFSIGTSVYRLNAFSFIDPIGMKGSLSRLVNTMIRVRSEIVPLGLQ